MYRLGVGLNIATILLSSSVAVRRLRHRSRFACWSTSSLARRHPTRLLGFTQRKYTSYQPFNSNVNAEPFLDGTSAVYVEQLYEDWLEDPTSVHKVNYCVTYPSSR